MRWLVWLALACHAAPAPRVAPVAPPPTTTHASDDRLAALAVGDDDFYRAVLYTWTTPDQISALRASRELLVATTFTGGFVSPYMRALDTLDASTRPGHDLAHALVTEPSLQRRRYAWPAPFATVLGLGARGYGHALIRIELSPDAWIGRFDPAAVQPFRFVDHTGATVAAADVLAHPERIGAIFHVRREPTIKVPFREYVVCNEAMVASWSVATPQIKAEVDDEVDMLHALADRASVDRAQWRAALAFDNAKYHPDRDALAAIADALAAYDPAGDPLTGP